MLTHLLRARPNRLPVRRASQSAPRTPCRLLVPSSTRMEAIRMAKPNYAFEKRQRDLAKKQKQEEKRLRKSGANANAPNTNAPMAQNPSSSSGDDDKSEA
jgi:hypothetical protein